MSNLVWPSVLTGWREGEQFPASDLLVAVASALGQWEDVLRGDGRDDAAGHVRLARSHLTAGALELPEPDDGELL